MARAAVLACHMLCCRGLTLSEADPAAFCSCSWCVVLPRGRAGRGWGAWGLGQGASGGGAERASIPRRVGGQARRLLVALLRNLREKLGELLEGAGGFRGMRYPGCGDALWGV